MNWINWKQFRRSLRAWGMSKSMSGAAVSDIIDGVIFDLTWRGETRRYVVERLMVRRIVD